MWKTVRLPFQFDRHQLLTHITGLMQLPQLKRATGKAAVLYEAGQVFLARLSLRERRGVGAAAITLGCLLSYVLIVEPVWEAYERSHARVAAKGRELKEVLALQQTYHALSQETRRIQSAQTPEFSPFAFLENMTTQIVGREKVSAINPADRQTQGGISRETIEVQLQGVSLRQLVELLHKMQTANVDLQTTRLSVKKHYKDPYSFDVFLTTLALTAE